jgi:putative cell wall-binding protein
MRRTALALLVALVAPLLAAAPAGAVTGPAPTEPVRARSYPDPFVLRVGSTYYAYATDGDLGEVQLVRSTDLVSWTAVGDVLQTAPSWAQDDDVWAPAVAQLGTGAFVLYASFVDTASGKRCIGTATAGSPEGPFRGTGSALVCDHARNGVIDPDVFVTGSTRYLLWKTEGVAGSEPPAVWSQRLSADGLSRAGTAARIFESRQPWEGTLVENPSMVSVDGRTYLFYSGNEWESGSYAIGWAACAGPQGPCIAPPNRPLLRSEPGSRIYGPGGGMVFADDAGHWMPFAAWTDASRTTEATGQRALFLRRIRFVGGRPQITGADGAYTEPAFTERVAGVSRYETAVALSASTVQPQRPIAYVATGADFPDALAAAPAAGREGGPVLLVQRDAVPAAVRSELARLRPGHLVVMGGTDAISSAVEADLRQYAGGHHREAGVNHYHRAALVSRNTFRDPNVPVVYVATGQAFPDALAGGAAATANGGPLLFVERDGIPVDPRTELERLNPARIVVLGGPAAVSHAVLAQLAQYSPRVDRVAGVDRYETAARIARSEFTKVDGSVAAAVVATGRTFPDAVTAGAAGHPVLLVPSTGPAPAVVKQALDALNPLGVLVLGGTSAVSQATVASLGL